MSTEPERVKQCLLSKWSIVAPGDWLEACLDWLHEDEQVHIGFNRPGVNYIGLGVCACCFIQ